MAWKLVDADNLFSKWREVSIDGQGNSLTLSKVISRWKFKLAFLTNHWAIFNQILYVSFQVQGNENSLTWCWSHDQDDCHVHIWYKHLKIFFPGTSGPISMKLGMKHQRLKLIIFCSNDNPVLIVTYFTAGSNIPTWAFIWENDNDGFFRNYCILWPGIWFII